VFPFDNSEQIAKVSTTTPIPPATVTLPNLLNHPLPSATQTAHSTQLYHSKQPPDHSSRPSLGHHHMLVYLTLMMQV
jgi:hypothetical protein